MRVGKAVTCTVSTHHPYIYVINHLHSGLLVLDLPSSSDNFLLSITVTHYHGHILDVIITGKCSTVETSVLNVTFHHYTQSYMLTCSKDPTVAFLFNYTHLSYLFFTPRNPHLSLLPSLPS